MQNKKNSFIEKLTFSKWTYIVFGGISIALVLFLFISAKTTPTFKTISQAGYTNRVPFFFWAFSTASFFFFLIRRFSIKFGVRNRWIVALQIVAFVLFLLVGIHDWPQVGQSLAGLLLHTVSACIFAGINWILIMVILFFSNKKQKSKLLFALFLVMIAVLIPCVLLMILFQNQGYTELFPLVFSATTLLLLTTKFKIIDGSHSLEIEKNEQKELLNSDEPDTNQTE